MTQFMVFQVGGPLATDPLSMMGWATDAADAQGAVENVVSAGIISNGTVHAVEIDTAATFEVDANPDVTAREDVPQPFTLDLG